MTARLSLVVAGVSLLAMLALACAAVVDSRQTPTWTVPPSAIIPVTGEQQPDTHVGVQEPSSAATAEMPGSPAPSGSRSVTAAASPRPEQPLPPAVGRASATPSHTLAELTTSGTASNMGPAFPPTYLALPQGPGWIARICGPGGCVTRVSNDKGPEAWTHRVADLSVHDFEAVCGCGWRMGLVSVSVVLTRRAG